MKATPGLRHARPVVAGVLLAFLCEAQAPREVSFETEILPYLKSTCGGCHGGAAPKKELDLTSAAGVGRGSESGAVVTPGKPEESLLYRMLHERRMPPGGKPVAPEAVLTAIRAWIGSGAPLPVSAQRVWQHDVIPVLYLRCTVCHGLRRREAGLDLRTKASMLAGGKSGPAILPGKPEESLLIRKVRAGAMPPVLMMLKAGVKPMTKAETDLIANWIAQGAPELAVQPDIAGLEPDPLVTGKDREFWAFRPPRRAAPVHGNSGRARNPIDGFLLDKLQTKDLMLSPEANRQTLIRRAYFDLTGLPPDPGEVEAFVADRDADAYEKLIDRLLASPRYGERWGRYWLDAAGYSDSEGKLNRDPVRPAAYRYRDYVIRAFNDDKPYDRFLLEQVAGDELADYENAAVVTPELVDNLIATGFLRMAADATVQPDMAFIDDRHEVIADEIDILGSTVMGLTIKCARCHSHKYDPIPQRDYYRLADVFKGAYDEHDWMPPDLDRASLEKDWGLRGRVLPYVTPGATPARVLAAEQQAAQRRADLEILIKEAQESLKKKQGEHRERVVEQRLLQVAEPLRKDLKGAVATPPEKRTESQKELLKKYSKLIEVEVKELGELSPEYRRESGEIEKRIKLLEAQYPAEPVIRALWDRGEPSPTYILRRGSASSFGRLVGPGVPSVLTDGKTPFVVTPPWPGAKKTGRRLALAKWLMRPDHPLTARVMVNRLWQSHFGTGLVKTVDNFGVAGARPSHPELLDWLATEFVERGWSVKGMHRLIMTSSAYRQASRVTPEHEKLDPDNALVSRFPMRRLDAEAIYDSLLRVSGRLDETPFGFPSPVHVQDDGSVTPIATEKGWRRGIYTLQRRKDTPTALASFDFPPMNPHCVQRTESTVAPQALYLLNDPMVRELAGWFAQRVEREAGSDPARQVERVFWLAAGRAPTSGEKEVSLATLEKLREIQVEAPLAKLCLSVFNTAAFLYID